ncbi:DUF4440 domain-containing protein [Paraburkholderia sp. DHOC27]|uniref:DUF4440 domain-containing protein n=1 Tax=Paraburkholderia sp. DHOC27 TaxID=2303330 RepID=UPI000E3B8117|nr:DUF4440 domain-containing protein [Paraburkholderia sp. DHOC27]RFU46991.1 DUF4440 domain-containing protein [Paraburkholderia sp. DHOC27]
MQEVNPYFAELGDINADVQAWYNSAADAAVFERLMARFSPQFSMVLPNGETLDHAALHAIFAANGGQYPGFEITMTDMVMVAQYPSGAVVTYKEHQRHGHGEGTLRRSTAVLERDAQGKVIWRHLQETFCAQ